jgi:hypothetical protein
MTLKFVESNHSYWLDGKRIKGVTTLLGEGLPKPAIPYWAAKSVAEYVLDNEDKIAGLREMGRNAAVAALKQIPWTKRDEAAVRGTDVHDIAEKLIHGQDVEVPDHLLGYVEGYRDWLDTFGVEPILTELPCASRKWMYGGKFDAILRMTRGPLAGRTILGDWKTSKGVYGETGLQTAAYASAEFYAPDNDTEIDMPHIDCTGVVHITEHGSTYYPLATNRTEIAEQFNLFTHIAHVAKRTDYIKGLLGEPLHLEEAS